MVLDFGVRCQGQQPVLKLNKKACSLLLIQIMKTLFPL